MDHYLCPLLSTIDWRAICFVKSLIVSSFSFTMERLPPACCCNRSTSWLDGFMVFKIWRVVLMSRRKRRWFKPVHLQIIINIFPLEWFLACFDHTSAVHHGIDIFLYQGLLAVTLESWGELMSTADMPIATYMVRSSNERHIWFSSEVHAFCHCLHNFGHYFFPIELRHQQSYIAGTFLLSSPSLGCFKQNYALYACIQNICIHVLILFQFDGINKVSFCLLSFRKFQKINGCEFDTDKATKKKLRLSL